MKHEDWLIEFLSIDLCGGTLVPLVNDDQDMLVVKWPDGMLIDVGFIETESAYYITSVADDTLENWNDPLSVIKITDRQALATALQYEIFRCRS